MGEEVKMSVYDDGSDGDEERVLDWEMGLPNSENLTPLSQLLIPPELASAFRISPEPHRTLQDVNRASRTTLSNLRSGFQALSSNNFKSFNDDPTEDIDPMVAEWEDDTDRDGPAFDSKKLRKVDCAEEADSALQTDLIDDLSGRGSKRPRLVWTPQLHKRFVDVVAHLGIKSAVPKTIMQLMNVDGLTRENVASHLQKYRLYLKRMQGFSNDEPSPSDQLLASTPLPQSLQEVNSSANSHGNGQIPMPLPMPYGPPPMMPMAVFGMPPGHGHMGIPMGDTGPGGPANGYHGFESYPYNLIQQRDWYGNKYGSVASYPHVAPNANQK